MSWVKPDDGADPRTGHETDSLVPFITYLGLGLLIALVYAAKCARRAQHRGLTLVTNAVGIAATIQCLAPSPSTRWVVWSGGDDLSRDIGVQIGLIGGAIWVVGAAMLAKVIEGDDASTPTATPATTTATTDARRGAPHRASFQLRRAAARAARLNSLAGQT